MPDLNGCHLKNCGFATCTFKATCSWKRGRLNSTRTVSRNVQQVKERPNKARGSRSNGLQRALNGPSSLSALWVSVCLCVKYHRRKHTGTMTHFWLLTHQMWMCHQEQKHAPCCCLWASAWWCSDAMIGEWWPLWTYNLFSDGVDSSPYVTLGLAILAPTSFSGHKIIGKSAASLCNVANGHLF